MVMVSVKQIKSVELAVKGTNAIVHSLATGAAGTLALIVDDHNTTQINAAALEAIDGVGTDTVVAAADQLTA